MKNLGVFYLIFMVLLSAMPCNDELETSSFTQQDRIYIGHGVAQSDAESCYPICSCTCCGQSMMETMIVSFSIKIPSLVLQKQHKPYNFILSQHNKNIWEPPKLVS